MAAKQNELNAAEIPEFQDSGVVSVGASSDLGALARDEMFANELVEINVHESTSENDLQFFMVNVNGINQPIARGQNQTIKRKYVEALARAKTTRYTQRTPNPSEPDRIETVPHTALSYPFSVLHDPNPLGRPWLQNILAER